MKNIGVLPVTLILIFALTACGGAGVGSADTVLATQPVSGSGEGAGIAAGATQTPAATARPISEIR